MAVNGNSAKDKTDDLKQDSLGRAGWRFNHFRNLHNWSKTEKARFIGVVSAQIHLATVAVAYLLLQFDFSQLNVSKEVLEWAFKLGMINFCLMFCVAAAANYLLKFSRDSSGLLNISLVLMALTLSLNGSFMGVFDGYTWLTVYANATIGSLILPPKIVYRTISLAFLVLLVMTFFPHWFAFPVRPYALGGYQSVAEMSLVDRAANWLLLAAVCYIGFWFKLFLLKESRNREDDLRSKSNFDELTAVLNRRGVMEKLSDEITRAREDGLSLSLAMLDLDFFKKINDTYGHQFGDEALVHTANHLKEIVRKTDLVARYGGEEFLIIFTECNIDLSEKVLERLMLNLKRDPIKTDLGQEVQLTLSAGLAQLRTEDSDIDNLIARADAALYIAKQSGRDQVVSDNVVSQNIRSH